jgi:hypothetical protein
MLKGYSPQLLYGWKVIALTTSVAGGMGVLYEVQERNPTGEPEVILLTFTTWGSVLAPVGAMPAAKS